MPLVSEPSPSRASSGSGVAVCGSFPFLPVLAFWSALAALFWVEVLWSEVVVEVLLWAAFDWLD